MTKRPSISAMVLLVLVAMAAGYGLRFGGLPGTVPGSAGRGALPAPLPDLQRSEQLARTYCSACHLFPEPSLLIKREWMHHIMPQVALRMGVEPVNYESLPDGKIMEEANLYPALPMIAEEDWFAIWDFYRTAAPSAPLPPPAKPNLRPTLPQFRVKKHNFHQGMPMVSLVKIEPTLKRLYVGDGYAGLLAALDPTGAVLQTVRVSSPPVSLSLYPSGLLVTLIGRFFPSDVLEGSVVLVPKDLASPPVPLLSLLRRPTDARLADVNQDGREDLVVCSFGNRLGQFAWYHNAGAGRFEERILFDRPGATRCEVRDFNRDGRSDILVLTGQAAEGMTLFYGQGGGHFKAYTLFEHPPTFGLVDFQLIDFNQDGSLDVLAVNGDNGDNPTPHKRYHGLRLYLNNGRNQFKETWFYPLEGAYKALGMDFDQDGDTDIAAIAFYPDYARQPLESFVYLENLGQLQFAPATFAESQAGRWMVMDAGDLDADGDADIVLGSFAAGPTTIPVPVEMRQYWKTNGAALVFLENVRR